MLNLSPSRNWRFFRALWSSTAHHIEDLKMYLVHIPRKRNYPCSITSDLPAGRSGVLQRFSSDSDSGGFSIVRAGPARIGEEMHTLALPNLPSRCTRAEKLCFTDNKTFLINRVSIQAPKMREASSDGVIYGGHSIT